MSEFSAVQAGLNAFRRRERHFVLTGATFGYLIGSCLIGAAFVAAARPALSELISWYGSVFHAAQNGSTPPDPSLDMFRAVAPWYGGFVLSTLIWTAVYEAACLRWMVRGETGGVLGLSLNSDTVRVFFTYLLWFVMLLAFLAGVGAFYAGLIAINASVPALRTVMIIVGALAPLGLIALLLWVATRLSPAAAMSVARRKFAFFSAWGATREKFWDLLGAFFIILAVYIAVSAIAQALVRVPLMQAIYPVMTQAMHDADFASIMSRFGEVFASPLIAAVLSAYVVLTIVLSALVRLAWFGVNAYAVAASDEADVVSADPAPQGAPPPDQSPPAPQGLATAAAPITERAQALETPPPEQAPTVENVQAPQAPPVAEAPTSEKLQAPEVGEPSIEPASQTGAPTTDQSAEDGAPKSPPPASPYPAGDP